MCKIIFTLLLFSAFQTMVFAQAGEHAQEQDEIIGNITFVKGSVEYFASGKVAQGNLAHDVEINGIKFTKHANYSGGRRRLYDIYFFESGEVKEGTFAETTKINGIVFEKNALISIGDGFNGPDGGGTLFYENGMVSFGVLAYPQEIEGIKFMGQINFYKDGRVERGKLAEREIKINDVLLSGDVTLYESGRIKGGLLIKNTKVGNVVLRGNVEGHREAYAGSNDITEFYESGKIKSGILGEPVMIGGEMMNAGQIAEFDEEGNISKVMPFEPGIVF